MLDDLDKKELIQKIQKLEKENNELKEKLYGKIQEKEVETEAKKELIDYSSWPISRLKSKYKSVTGNVCKLKKDEIIEFLQNKDKDSDV